MWNFSSVAILTCHTKNVYKILSLGLSKDSSRKEKVWLVIKDCALSGTLLCSQSIFHSILVISALFSHATQNVLQWIFLYYNVIIHYIFPIFLQTLILLKGRKGLKQEKKVKKFQGEYEKKKKRILMSKPILEKVVMKLWKRLLIHGCPPFSFYF